MFKGLKKDARKDMTELQEGWKKFLIEVQEHKQLNEIMLATQDL